jgi:hypothetical protein
MFLCAVVFAVYYGVPRGDWSLRGGHSPARDCYLLMSTDLASIAGEIIRLYRLRSKLESKPRGPAALSLLKTSSDPES